MSINVGLYTELDRIDDLYSKKRQLLRDIFKDANKHGFCNNFIHSCVVATIQKELLSEKAKAKDKEYDPKSQKTKIDKLREEKSCTIAEIVLGELST